MLLDTSSMGYIALQEKISEESDYARKLRSSVNNTKNISISNKLITSIILIDELHEDINLAINDNQRHGIVHPQILTPKILKETIQEFKTTQRTRYNLDSAEESYQHILDISQINVAIIKHVLTHVIKIPTLEKKEVTIRRILPIPELIQNTYISLIPE